MRRAAAVICLLLTACSVPTKSARKDIAVSTSSFAPDGPIPSRYTCDGKDVSPDLSWSAPPKETREIAIVMIDVDVSGRFIHWLLYHIPPAITHIASASEPIGALAGRNSFGDIGYGGPCPPPGKGHRYTFVVFALKRESRLSSGATFEQLDGLQAVLDRGQVTGTYTRA